MQRVEEIRIERGESVRLAFSMSPAEDIRGWSIRFAARERGRAALVKHNAAGVSIIDAQQGSFTVSLLGEDTEQLAPGVYAYDLWRTDRGVERVLAVGDLIVETRRTG